jgi:Type IV secretion system pilin
MIKKILFTVFSALTLSLVFSGSTLAAIQLDDNLRPENLPTIEPSEATDPDHPETAATQTLILFVGNIVSQVLLFTGALTIIFVIIAGINYIFAFGKDERIERGKRGLFWSLFGLIIILLSYAIVQGILQVVTQVDESVS